MPSVYFASSVQLNLASSLDYILPRFISKMPLRVISSGKGT